MLLFDGHALKDPEIVDGSTIRVVLADDYYNELGRSNDIKMIVKVFEKGQQIERGALEVETKLSDSLKVLEAKNRS